MSKFALPALILLIFALLYESIASDLPDGASDIAGPPTQIAQTLPDAGKNEQSREQRPAAPVDSVRAELQRLSDVVKSNSDKVAETATLRSELQDAKSSSSKIEKSMLDQIGALRADQAKSMQEAKDASDKAAQALRRDVEASQAKLAAQVDDTLKGGNARLEALAQRVDAMKKDVDAIKKDIDEERQNRSSISPAFALVVAIAALLLGPFVARQLTANQLAAARKQEVAEPAVVAHPKAARAAVADPPLAAAEPPPKPLFDGEAPSVAEERTLHDEKSAQHQTERDPEKV